MRKIHYILIILLLACVLPSCGRQSGLHDKVTDTTGIEISIEAKASWTPCIQVSCPDTVLDPDADLVLSVHWNVGDYRPGCINIEVFTDDFTAAEGSRLTYAIAEDNSGLLDSAGELITDFSITLTRKHERPCSGTIFVRYGFDGDYPFVQAFCSAYVCDEYQIYIKPGFTASDGIYEESQKSLYDRGIITASDYNYRIAYYSGMNSYFITVLYGNKNDKSNVIGYKLSYQHYRTHGEIIVGQMPFDFDFKAVNPDHRGIALKILDCLYASGCLTEDEYKAECDYVIEYGVHSSGGSY